jgi:FixJ family two-component response regulator
MQNQVVSRLSGVTETGSTGSSDSADVLYTSPDDWSNQLPICSPPAVEPIETVVVLCSDANVLAMLQGPVAEMNAALQQYFSLQTMLADPPPTGPACLLVDLDCADADGMVLCKRLKARGWQLPTIVLANRVDVRMVVQVMREGVADILPKGVAPTELIAALREALNQSQQQWQWQSRNGELQRRWAQLTPRECEIVKLVLAGMLNKQIAEKLHLALVTIKVRRASAMRKLGARNAAELARLALAVNYSSALAFDFNQETTRPIASQSDAPAIAI